MKILIISPGYPPARVVGGVETHVKELAERLAKDNNVEVYTMDGVTISAQKDILNGVKVIRFKPIALGKTTVYRIPPPQMLHSIRNSGADIIHAHGIQTLVPFFASLGSKKSQFVITSHYSGGTRSFRLRKILFRMYKPLLHYSIDKASRIICVSEVEKENITRDFKVNNKKITIIPNGVRTFTSGHVGRRNTGEFRILYVGRLDFSSKKIDKLIEAFALINRNDFRLVMIGDGPDRKNIIRMIDHLKILDRVEMILNASEKELANEYHKADLFVMLSPHESFGIAVREALAAGIKAIVSKSGATEELASKNYAYGIDPPVTPEKIAEAIVEVNRRKIQFDKYFDYYSWESVATALSKEYGIIINQR
jgi:glycosyltransferase involved in cell wall biosynthesis